MWYKEYLRVRNALFWFTVTLLAMLAFIGIVMISSHGGGHVSVVVGPDPTIKPSSHGIEALPWVALFSVAALAAAILATVLGSALSQENDGHLEYVCTKPRSRSAYVAMLMAVDGLGIIVATLIAFGFVYAAVEIIVGNLTRITWAPVDLPNAVRFALFPVAWYAIIAALTASTRRAGIVQGLIWPIALGLGGLEVVPLPPVWHTIVSVIDAVNPWTYITVSDKQAGFQIGPGVFAGPTVAVIALLLLCVAGWIAATLQWRRVEA